MTDHANELRRYSRKIGPPAGDVPSVMLAAADEIERLAAKLEAAEKERDALRAKIAEMEQREPVGVLHVGSYYGEELQDWEFEANQCACDKLNEAYVRNPMSLPLYASPGAQAAPNVPEGWLRAIDEALVVTHLGVANASDTYEQAKNKLDSLIGFHVDVATDPAVNGGWKLVPIVSTDEMDNAGSEHCDGYLSTAQVVWDAMLAAVPEAK